MELVLTEEHELVAKAARDFVVERSPVRRARQGGFAPELWAAMAEMGWLGLTIPEEHGGSGMGHVYAMLVLEELGRELVPEPVLPALWGAEALALAGSPAQRAEHLPAIAAGKRLIVPALDEAGARWSAGGPSTTARDGRLSGEKTQVVGAPAADAFVVSAGGRLFLVPASETRIEKQQRLDGRDAGIVRLDGARGEPLPEDALEPLLARAAILLCAEMLGSAAAAFDRTLAYLKSRQQFGVPIGSFQALQHRAARLFVELELARGAVQSAHALLDAGADVARAASAVKAKCSEVFLAVAHEAVQMHGGIGMTEEHDIGLYLKRARVAEMTLGDAAHHRDRYARFLGL